MPVDRVPIVHHPDSPVGPTNAYVVDGDEPLLIDPADRADDLDAVIDRTGISHLAVTHTHPDHTGGLSRYADAYDVTVWARENREGRFEEATGVSPDRTFREGTIVGPTTVVETPGHAPDHVAFAQQDAAITGDVAVKEGSVAISTGEGDMRVYLTTLRRLRAMDFETLYPAHGDVITQPRETLERLVHHRRDREKRVLSAVESGAETPDEIVDAAYDQDLTGLREMAKEAVRAHLQKLDAEGIVDWDGERAQPT